MAYTIVAGGVDWTLTLLSESRNATLKFAGSPGETSTVKELYLAIMDRMDELSEMSESNPMTADTPTEYNIGLLGAGASDPWFIDKDSVEKLTGGAIKTVGWKRDLPGDGSGNTGIVKVIFSSTFNLIAADIGDTCTHTDGDTGTIIDINIPQKEVWIRPTNNELVNDWNSASGDLTCTTAPNRTALTQTAAAVSGEMQWSNIYNGGIATLASGTHQFIYQGDRLDDSAYLGRVETYQVAGEDWWGDGTFDVLLLVADQADDLAVRGDFIDGGFAGVFARQYGTTYSFYNVDLFAGGRNPIPLETGSDLNNTTGYYITTAGNTGSGFFLVGEEINDDATGLERAIVTEVTGTEAAPILAYYLIGDPQDNIEAEAITGVTSTSTAVMGTPSLQGPGTLSGMSIAYANNNTKDINADDVNEYYSITIDCSDERLFDMYEWTKYIARNGGQTTGDTDGIEAEQYLGIDYRMTYASNTGPILEGDSLIQDNTGTTGTVVAIHTGSTPDWVTIRNTRGTWSYLTADQMKKDGTPGNYLVPNNDPTEVIPVTPVKPNPFGVFAGGFWFLAQGVVLDNRHSDDANAYSTIDDTTGVIYEEPTSITISITNTRQEDKVAIYRLDQAGGIIEKDYYDLTAHTEDDDTIVVDGSPAIRVDEPGKTTGGWLIVGDVLSGEEHIYRYSSWTGSVFTLDQHVTGTGDGSSSTTVLADAVEDSGDLDAVVVGELLHDTTNNEYAWCISNSGSKSITTTLKTTTWLGAAYVVNDVVISYTTNDYVYVPLLYAYEVDGTDGAPDSEAASLVYDTTIPALVRARNATEATYKIKPFGQEISITGNSGTAVVRTTETITS